LKGVTLSDDTIRSFVITFRALSRSYIRLYPGVEELLGLLKKRNKKIYLLSNAQADFTRPEITMLGIDHFFDGIFISSEQGVKKPGRLFYERLLETYSLDPKESIMIGNDEEADIAGAQDVGMDSLYIHSNISPSKYGKLKPTYSVLDGDFTKIRDLILT
ncbi:MAG: HAD family hydrolase, partial [Lachnospiraceae bacterium]|nr:HAD family hydrolase [Lachnospiraceae bacterium]